jgi:peptidoglycan/LPS O-acetylase OafA/YrhL
MDPVSVFPALVALSLALGTCFVITRIFGSPLEAGRFASIDGLRGYLALFVYLSHGCLWYFYLRSSQWVVPPSRPYTHMGQSSVAMFFMITAFLFFSKLLGLQNRRFDWTRLFLSRFMRLGPLYFFAICLMFVIVLSLSHGVLQESLPLLAKHLIEWLAFCVVGGPDVNGVRNTVTITAGATWSLQYEWAFYCAPPILALCLQKRPPLQYVSLGLLTCLGFSYLHPNAYNLLAFAAGIGAAWLSRSDLFCRFCSTRAASWIILSSTCGAVIFYSTAQAAVPLLLLSLAFSLIACGNSLFGILVHPVSRTLGQMAYSIYLLHGIALFVAFNFVVGLDSSRRLSSTAHWILVIGVTPVLVAVCYSTFRIIEYPAMQSTDKILFWLRSGPLRRRVKRMTFDICNRTNTKQARDTAL